MQHVMKKIGNAGVGQLSFGIARGHSLTDVVSARNAVRQKKHHVGSRRLRGNTHARTHTRTHTPIQVIDARRAV